MKVLNGTGSQYPPPVTGLQLDIVALVTTLIPGPEVPPTHTHTFANCSPWVYMADKTCHGTVGYLGGVYYSVLLTLLAHLRAAEH